MKSAPIPKPSASVILLRQHSFREQGFQVYLLKRAGKSSFMPGRYVFPGGGVEQKDGDDPMADTTLRRCAIRELWEESGVVLARPIRPEAAWPSREADQARQALNCREISLDEALYRAGLSCLPRRLTPHARWITPKARPKRFDTMFYLALMPEGQTADSDHKETSLGVWVSPEEALAQNQSGEVALAPPQVRLMGELAGSENLERLFASSPDPAGIKPVTPVLVAKKDARTILLPWDPDYQAPDLPSAIRPCHGGRATRLVHISGRWLPYSAN